MLFSDAKFIFVFLPATLFAVATFDRVAGRNGGFIAIILSSFVFYAYWRWEDLAIIIVSIATNFAISRILLLDWRKSRLLILWIGIAFNLSLLGFFKYSDFFLATLGRQPLHIVLPLAISFYSFQQIAFLVDMYRRSGECITLTNYLVAVTFFPHLIAGPLIHYQTIKDQFTQRFGVSLSYISAGLPIFAIGLAKKVAIADPIAMIIDPIFHRALVSPVEFVSSWVAALGYAAQLYFDFSGYSDMAIGLALMFGIALPVNFRSPYKAKSIIEFWRRWHITLSSFLRDYLYIPLGGSRVSQMRRHLNILTVMLIGGLWHGAAWTFVAWGGLHGLYLMVNHLWRDCAPRLVAVWLTPIYGPLTFFAVILGWVFFRSPTFSAAGHLLQGMAGLTWTSLPGEIAYFIPSPTGTLFGVKCDGLGLSFADLVSSVFFLGLAYLMIFLLPNLSEVFNLDGSHLPEVTWRFLRNRLVEATITGAAMSASCFGVLGAAPSAFIYFRF